MREALLHLPIPADAIPPSGQAVQEVACRNLPSDTGQIFRSATHVEKLWSYMLHALHFPLQLLFLFSTLCNTFYLCKIMCCKPVGDHSSIFPWHYKFQNGHIIMKKSFALASLYNANVLASNVLGVRFRMRHRMIARSGNCVNIFQRIQCVFQGCIFFFYASVVYF